MACTEQTRTDNSCLSLAVVAINIPKTWNSKVTEKLYLKIWTGSLTKCQTFYCLWGKKANIIQQWSDCRHGDMVWRRIRCLGNCPELIQDLWGTALCSRQVPQSLSCWAPLNPLPGETFSQKKLNRVIHVAWIYHQNNKKGSALLCGMTCMCTCTVHTTPLSMFLRNGNCSTSANCRQCSCLNHFKRRLSFNSICPPTAQAHWATKNEQGTWQRTMGLRYTPTDQVADLLVESNGMWWCMKYLFVQWSD